ncbi:MAG: diaminopimelate epimerase [Candidatus Koribacter versatilis]|uniref:Diaminopimelate epimerase n=1 Tax=Candidatus Korobacter versatilis TaxID=658062 RepID=A0A932ERF6_9BACT|nr:diaminopimelate epimerase [Candidatus Koribacter versatilis]
MPFVKASACGNDFLLIEGMHMPPDLVAFAKRICDRHNGVGADGVEWLLPDKEASVRARLFNADGSEAEISGNGTRCVAAHWVDERGGETLTVRTGAGVKTCRLTAHDANVYWFETDMGEPQVGDEFAIKLAFGEVRGVPVSMGNPHFVVFVPEFSPGWQAEAAEIGKHHDFKYGINVELVRASKSDAIEMRIFERGAGETQSSGTGSCAAAVASIHAKKAASPVKVIAPGGVQTVRWDGQSVFLNGPAQLICRGEFFI